MSIRQLEYSMCSVGQSYNVFLLDVVSALVVERHEMLGQLAVIELVLRVEDQENQIKSAIREQSGSTSFTRQNISAVQNNLVECRVGDRQRQRSSKKRGWHLESSVCGSWMFSMMVLFLFHCDSMGLAAARMEVRAFS